MAFKRKITKMIEKLETSMEGQENPQISAVLRAMDEELSQLKKSAK